MPASKNPIENFDELTATTRVTLYLYKHPKSGITQVIKNAGVGQKAAYAAKDWLEENGLLLVGKKETLPYTPVLSLSEKGMKIGAHLTEIEKILFP
jgi:predicted transcriptional regulator